MEFDEHGKVIKRAANFSSRGGAAGKPGAPRSGNDLGLADTIIVDRTGENNLYAEK